MSGARLFVKIWILLVFFISIVFLPSVTAEPNVKSVTHYPENPFSYDEITVFVEVIDPSPAIARQAGRLLDRLDLAAGEQSAGAVNYWTTGDPQALAIAARQLIGRREEARAAAWDGHSLRAA